MVMQQNPLRLWSCSHPIDRKTESKGDRTRGYTGKGQGIWVLIATVHGGIESLGKARSSSPENLSLLGLCLQAIYLEQGQQVLSTVTSFFHAPD